MSEHATGASTMGRGRTWILGGLILVALITLYAVYFYALFLIVSVVV
jgi:hypothetical protein